MEQHPRATKSAQRTLVRGHKRSFPPVTETYEFWQRIRTLRAVWASFKSDAGKGRIKEWMDLTIGHA